MKETKINGTSETKHDEVHRNLNHNNQEDKKDNDDWCNDDNDYEGNNA